MPHSGTLELTIINDDKNTHACLLPSNGDRQFIGLVNHSKGSATIELDGTSSCPADVTGDGTVDGADLAALLGAWGTSTNDLNGDGIVDGADLASMLTAWGACP